MKTDIEKLRQLHAQGLTRHEIAQRLGINVTTVYYNLKKIGLRNNFTQISKQVENQVLTCIADGDSSKQVMDRFNISYNQYYRCKQKYQKWFDSFKKPKAE